MGENPSSIRPVAQTQRERRKILGNVPGFELERRVLIADDDLTTAAALSSLENAENCAVVRARDGAEVYRILRGDADFQAAVLNATLPRIEGVELVRYMKTENRLKRIPIVIITAGHDYGLVAQFFAAGAIALIYKPFSPDRLWRMLQVIFAPAIARRRAA
jgi:CheY-like chemotaxis protein